MPSRWNYILAFISVPMAILNLVIHQPAFAAIWVIGGALHLYVGNQKDKKNADPRN